MELINLGTLLVLLFCALIAFAWWRALLRILAALLVLAVVVGVIEILRVLGMTA